jgi:hypothetical protein
MKIKYLLPVVVLALILGCTTAKITPANPSTGTPATTNYIVDPRLVSAIDTAKGVAGVIAPVNPYAGAVDIGLGTVAAIAAWVAKRKNDKLAAQTLLTKTVVQSIDAQDNQAVKDAIQAHASRIGVEGELNTFVKQVAAGAV